MTVKLSKKARSDLIGIWEYTYEYWSLKQADRYYHILINRIDDIGQNPDLGRSYGNFKKGYFGVSIKSHIIFYRIHGSREIEIMRVLHQRMDLKKRLNANN